MNAAVCVRRRNQQEREDRRGTDDDHRAGEDQAEQSPRNRQRGKAVRAGGDARERGAGDEGSEEYADHDGGGLDQCDRDELDYPGSSAQDLEEGGEVLGVDLAGSDEGLHE